MHGRAEALPRRLALAWMLVVALIAAHQWQFWRAPQLDTDVFSLLPQDEQAPAAQRAMRQLGEQGERRVLVMLGAADWEIAKSAAAHFDRALLAENAGLRRVADNSGAAPALDFFQPWRNALLTESQRAALREADPKVLAQQALVRLHGLNTGQPAAWLVDPLGLWPDWWSQRSGLTAARPRDGLLWVPDSAGRREWAVLLYETDGSAFRLDGQRRWGDALDRAGAAATGAVVSTSSAGVVPAGAGSTVRLLMAGVPLHAEAGAVQGNREMSTIGWGSLAAVVALVWWAFWALRPVFLIAASLLVGCAAGLSATVWLFGNVHVITLVFGASLVGVAEDFGIHYFASRLAAPSSKRMGANTSERWALMKHLLPGLSLALVTSVLGYLVMAAVPFPGLRQMAVFSSVGLVAAFLTAVCWFAVLDRGNLPGSAMARGVAASLAHWPRLRGRTMVLTLVVLALPCAWGIVRLQVSDDLRLLQSSPPRLIAEQIEVGRLLRMPSPAQFFLVQGPDAQAVLQREEALKARLAPQLQPPMAGATAHPSTSTSNLTLSAVSDWVPSQARQAQSRALTEPLEDEVVRRVGHILGEDLSRPVFAAQTLEVGTWLTSPVSAGLRAQWLGQIEGATTSVVLVGGLSNRAQADALRIAGEQGEGVRWIDRTSDMSRLLGRVRASMTWLLFAGHLLVWAALALRFGRNAWRAWLPTGVASLVCLAVLGALGEPFQLFTLLALMLLLGMGVDYGVFLLEHRGEGQGHAWLAVVLGALSTGLSFGLLALSATPALHAFGLTLLVGLSLVCLLAPCLRLPDT